MSSFTVIFKKRCTCLNLTASMILPILLMCVISPRYSMVLNKPCVHGFTSLQPLFPHSAFFASKSNPSLFLLHTSTSITLMLIYVDDILIISSDNSLNSFPLLPLTSPSKTLYPFTTSWVFIFRAVIRARSSEFIATRT
jgi:hypothetical protein